MTAAVDDSARHNEKMKKKKAARDKIMAKKTEEKGLLMVHTGKGKGKSTAAFGMVFRALGQGMKVAVVQFVKGAWQTGEAEALKRFSDQVDVFIMGQGFTWETQDKDADIRAARAAWEIARDLIMDDVHDMVLLDELNIVLRYDYLPTDEIVGVLQSRPAMKHVIVTGRNAKDDVIGIADLVTEMTQVKHPFRDGIKAQKGVEF